MLVSLLALVALTQAPPPVEPVRGIYVNAWAFESTKRLGELIRLAEGTEVNPFVIDVKDDTGYLTYRSIVPTAIAIGANTSAPKSAPRKSWDSKSWVLWNPRSVYSRGYFLPTETTPTSQDGGPAR